MRGVGAPYDRYRLTYGGGTQLDPVNLRTRASPIIAPGERVFIAVVAGQSNSANFVDTTYASANPSKVLNVSIFDGGTYIAADPMVGCDNGNAGGSWMGRLADKLIAAGKYDKVIFAPTGIGGSPIQSWAPGGPLNDRLQVAPRRLKALGLTPTVFLWQQGESNYDLTQAQYLAFLQQVIATPRLEGFNAPWLIAKSTYVTGGVYEPVRSACAAIVNGTDIFAGPDSDTLTAAFRAADNVHYNAPGADAVANLWRDAIVTALGL